MPKFKSKKDGDTVLESIVYKFKFILMRYLESETFDKQ